MSRIRSLLVVILLTSVLPTPVLGLDLTQIFTPKPLPAGDERKETIERIRETQDRLRLLQDKLRSLEKRRALEAAAQAGVVESETAAGESNWQAIDQATLKPGEFGLYTYLLYAGNGSDRAAREAMEDLILTIEALPENPEPAIIGNRFLVPTTALQSTVILARRPYDFKLSRSYLERLGLTGLPDGPVLVSLNEPLDPFGRDMAPPFLAVALGRQDPQWSLMLSRVWHGYEKSPLPATGHPLADLFWQLVDGTGSTNITRNGGKLLIDLAPATAAVPSLEQLNR
ncbi:MAG: hypothetical protein NDI73_08455 [Desulfuromonadales bacterium]|nr:hypothetical protein [Desulfuromonadales bacterium]